MNKEFIIENGIKYTVEIRGTGDKYWLLDKQFHREGGPAMEWANGSKHWYRNGKLHREDGPAAEDINGDKWWYRNGLLHREDGPAFECVDGYKAWYLNGVTISVTSNEQFMRMMNLKAFL